MPMGDVTPADCPWESLPSRSLESVQVPLHAEERLTTTARAAETICWSTAAFGKTGTVDPKLRQQPSVQLPKMSGKDLKSLTLWVFPSSLR